MNYADIKRIDVANGTGVRVSLFVSGCTHRCKECFNPETWDFDFVQPFGEEQIQTILTYLDKSYIHGLSLLGGEPFEPQNQGAVMELVRWVREELPQKDIWCYSGYLFEELAAGKIGVHSRTMLGMLDVLVDGPFVLEKKDLSLRFRGSSNQRIIDVRKSLESGTVYARKDLMGD